MRTFLTLFIAVVLSQIASAQIDVERLETWADETFSRAYEQERAFSGLGFVVVKGNEVVIEKTYGFATYNPSREIDTEQTRFLIGSITKTFVGLAVAQLVERGDIQSVDEPANKYLTRTTLPKKEGVEVSILDLLTHSAGYDQRLRDVGTLEAVEEPITSAEIKRLAPKQVRASGELVSYSNYSTGILAILLEDITGLAVEDYFDQEIWTPLDMSSAAFHRASTVEEGVAKSFYPSESGMVEAPFVAFHPFYYPVGGIGVSMRDMTQYLKFHLAGSRGEDTAILSADMHAQLRSKLRSNHPLAGGFGFQMMTFEWNGHTVFGHGGTWPTFESMIMVIPEQDIAIFYSITAPTSLGNLKLNDMLLKELFGDFEAPQVSGDQQDGNASVVGLFRPTMRAYHSAEAVLGYLGNGDTLRVHEAEDGLFVGESGPFKNLGDGVYWAEDAGVTRELPFGSPIFTISEGGEGGSVYLTPFPGMTPFQKINLVDTPTFWLPKFAILKYMLFIGLIAFVWPRGSVFDGIAKLIAIVVTPALFFLFPIFLNNHGPAGLGGYIINGEDGRFIQAALIGTSLFIAFLVVTARAGLMVRDGDVALWKKAHSIVYAALLLIVVVFVSRMNLVGFFIG
ncbi:MAG: hypothetical protein Hens3KO_18100 [Henriciella sp.]